MRALDLTYQLAVCLHEDWESAGYYIYEHKADGRPGLGRAMLEAVEPICGIDRTPVIEKRPARNGLITSKPGTVSPEEIGGWAEALYLGEGACPEVYTLEAPSARELATRVKATSPRCGSPLPGPWGRFLFSGLHSPHPRQVRLDQH